MGGNMEGKKISCCTETWHLKCVPPNCTFSISDYVFYIYIKKSVRTCSPIRTLSIKLHLPTLPTVNLPGKGNLTPAAEFNFSMDAESAYVVLEEYTCPTHIATWEFTCRNKLSWVRASQHEQNQVLHEHIVGLTNLCASYFSRSVLMSWSIRIHQLLDS